MIKELMKTTLLKMIIIFGLITLMILISYSSNDSHILKIFGVINDPDKVYIEALRFSIKIFYIVLVIALIIKTLFIDLRHFKNYKIIIVDKASNIFLFVVTTTIIISFYDIFISIFWGLLCFYIMLAKSLLNQITCVFGFEWQDNIRNHCNVRDKVMYVPDYKFESYSYLLSEKLIIHEKCIIFKDRTLNIHNIKEIKSLLSKNISELSEDDFKIIDMLII